MTALTERLRQIALENRLDAFTAWLGVFQFTHDLRLIQERIERDSK